MRRAPVLLLVAVLLGGAACTSRGTPPPGASPGPTGTAVASGPCTRALPAVSGAVGAEPTVKIPAGNPCAVLQSSTLVTGTGPVVRKGDVLVVNYSGRVWRDGKVFDDSFTRGVPGDFVIGAGQLIPGWDETLVGVTTGSRVLLVIPPDKAYGAAGQPQAGIQGNDTLVFVIDVLGAFAPTAAATGQPVPASPAAGPLPQVSGGPGQRPTVSIPQGAAPPADLVVRTLLQGNGPKIEKGRPAVLQYLGYVWGSGKLFDSSWDRGQPASFPIGNGATIPAWDSALVGVPTGSRVLLVVPPKDGFGSQGRPQIGISGTDTLVFVIDVIGTY